MRRKNSRMITYVDHARLSQLLESLHFQGAGPMPRVGQLVQRLESSDRLESRDVPRDLVTMNSRVKVCNIESGETWDLRLAYPEDANLDDRWYSILAPICQALLGARVGDIVEFMVPAGEMRLRIDEILYQPESQRHYHL